MLRPYNPCNSYNPYKGVGWLGRAKMFWCGVGVIVLGAFHVDYDSANLLFVGGFEGGLGFGISLMDYRYSAEELVSDVGENGGAPGGDFVLSQQKQQTREEIVKFFGGFEGGEIGGEFGGGFLDALEFGVCGAERILVEGRHHAAFAVGEAVLAALFGGIGGDVFWLVFHFGPRSFWILCGGYRCLRMVMKTR
jgi:hypothetical protein